MFKNLANRGTFMHFSVVGREVDVELKHFLIVFGTIVVLTIVAAAVAIPYAYLSSSAFGMAMVEVTAMSFAVVTPLSAFLMLFLVGIVLKKKKDAALCRSLAAASFMLYALLYIVFMGLAIALGHISFNPLYDAANLFSAGSAAILLYLWLLIFLKPDGKKVGKTMRYAAIYAIAFFIIQKLYLFFSYYNTATVYTLTPTSALIIWMVHNFLFGLALLYFAKEIKKLNGAAYLFAGLFLGSSLLYTINKFIVSPGLTEFLVGISDLVMSAVALVLVYLLSCKLEEKTKQ